MHCEFFSKDHADKEGLMYMSKLEHCSMIQNFIPNQKKIITKVTRVHYLEFRSYSIVLHSSRE